MCSTDKAVTGPFGYTLGTGTPFSDEQLSAGGSKPITRIRMNYRPKDDGGSRVYVTGLQARGRGAGAWLVAACGRILVAAAASAARLHNCWAAAVAVRPFGPARQRPPTLPSQFTYGDTPGTWFGYNATTEPTGFFWYDNGYLSGPGWTGPIYKMNLTMWATTDRPGETGILYGFLPGFFVNDVYNGFNFWGVWGL